MAIFDWSFQPIKRSVGRSAVDAAAYRAGVCLQDERTGLKHDYSRRAGIHSEMVLPPGLTEPDLAEAIDQVGFRSWLWNEAERRETRKNSVTAKEIVCAIPCELSPDQRLDLVQAYAQYLAGRFGVIVDTAIHPPSRNGDQRNWHSHMMLTTRRIEPGLVFGAKTRELDVAYVGGPIIKELREEWAAHCNALLKAAGFEQSISHLSLKERGIQRAPNRHLGPITTHIARGLRSQARKLLEEADALDRETAIVARKGKSIPPQNSFDHGLDDRTAKTPPAAPHRKGLTVEILSFEEARYSVSPFGKPLVRSIERDVMEAAAEQTRLHLVEQAKRQREQQEAARKVAEEQRRIDNEADEKNKADMAEAERLKRQARAMEQARALAAEEKLKRSSGKSPAVHVPGSEYRASPVAMKVARQGKPKRGKGRTGRNNGGGRDGRG